MVHGDCQEAAARSKPRWGELWELSSPGRAPSPRQLSPSAARKCDLRLPLRLAWSRPRWCTATAKRQPPAASRAGVSSRSSAPQAERQVHASCRLQLHENGDLRLRLRLAWSRPRWCTATAKRQPPAANRAGVSSQSSAPQAERQDPRQLSPPAARKWWLAPAPPTRPVEAAVVHGDCQEAATRSKPRWGELSELSSPGRAPNPRQLSPSAARKRDLRLRLRLGWSRLRWCTATAKRQPPAANRAGVSCQSSAPQAERQNPRQLSPPAARKWWLAPAPPTRLVEAAVVHGDCQEAAARSKPRWGELSELSSPGRAPSPRQLSPSAARKCDLRLRLRLGWSRPRWCTATAKRQPPAASRAGVSCQSSAPQAERQVHVSCRLQLHENGGLRLRLRPGWSRPRYGTATAKRQPPAASRAGVSSGSSAPQAERQIHVSCRLQLHGTVTCACASDSAGRGRGGARRLPRGSRPQQAALG